MNKKEIYTYTMNTDDIQIIKDSSWFDEDEEIYISGFKNNARIILNYKGKKIIITEQDFGK